MRKRLVAALALLPAMGGCMQYLVQPPAPSIAGSPHEVEARSYLGSEVQQPPYVLAQKCVGGEQLSRVIVKRNFGQGLVGWLTFGLVAPATIVYECANAGEPGLGDTGGGR
jgi:hypothetical protein